MDRRWDAEDEGFKTFETAEVLGTWRQSYTAFNAPWKRLRSDICRVMPLPARVFLCQWIYTLDSGQNLCFSWMSFLVASSPWYGLFMESEFLCRCVMHLLPDPLVFAVGSMSPLLMDTWSHLMVEKNRRMFCCLHSSSWFGSVEQLTKATAGICCGQKEWTVWPGSWRDLLPLLRKLFQTACFQGLPVSSGPFLEQKTWEKLLQSLQSSQEAVADISTCFLITWLFKLVTNQLPLATQSGTSYC